MVEWNLDISVFFFLGAFVVMFSDDSTFDIEMHTDEKMDWPIGDQSRLRVPSTCLTAQNTFLEILNNY